MIDIHCHLIFGIDDGPETICDSLQMVLMAEKLGISTIIATPHYNRFAANPEKANDNYRKLVYAAKQESGVEIKFGYEICGSFRNYIDAGENRLTLDNSGYMLVELSAGMAPADSIDTLYELQVKSIVPVIAHPERYKFFLKDFEIFSEFIKRGCLIQLDAASIIGINGRKCKRFARQMIKLKTVHFISSNAYCAKDYVNYISALKKIRKWAGKEYSDKLLFKNAKAILENTEKSIYEMI